MISYLHSLHSFPSSLLRIATLLLTSAIVFGNSPLQAQSSSVQGVAESQVRRLEITTQAAKGLVDKGAAALDTQDYESAFAFYKSAFDMLPSGGSASSDLRAEALAGFSEAAVQLTRQRISEGRIQDANTTVSVVLEERYNPTYRPALDLQVRLKDPTSFSSQTMTPNFVANVEEVKRLLQEGQGFFASARYDLAFKRYEQVLNVDKYNIAARRGMEQVNVARQKYSSVAYSETRGDMIRQVNKGWELPVRMFNEGASTIIEQPQLDTRGTASINRKLDEIVIPKIDFRDATVREALDFIRQRAAALDTTESDSTRKGVNIVPKFSVDSIENSARITLALSDVPLRAAIDYVARAANLKLKVEPFAVVIVPQSESTDVLITKEYKVPPSFITALPATTAPPSTAGGVAAGSQASITARSGAREFLESQGVTFASGASANYISSSSRLIVRNTQGNLDLVDTLVENSISTPPSQVEIEAKFLEVTQNNLKELGFDWLLGQVGLPFGTGVYGGGGTQGGNSSINANSFPFLNPGSTTTPIGASSPTSGPLTAGNRSGTAGISVNAVDALLFGSPVGPAPAILALAGVFTNPQFQVVLRALDQQKGVDLVSAPRVTTKSGQRAQIEIVREFLYPSEYDLPQVTQTSGGILTPVTPTTPTAFEMKPIGITLEVEPTVGPDGFTIDLVLAPRVTEFDGFINYGSPIRADVTVFNAIAILGTAVTANVLVTENTINRPVFSTREITTQVSVLDGSTVVLGGLMREDVQKIEDKVPIIGDIPFVGRLFRTSADQHIKRNLIIFVTAGLIDPAGQPLIKTDEEDQIVAAPDARALGEEIIPGDALSVPFKN